MATMLDELKGYLDGLNLPVPVGIGLFPAVPVTCVALVEREAVNPTERAFIGQRITYPRIEVLSRAPSYALARVNLDLVTRPLATIVNQIVGGSLYLSVEMATLAGWVGPAVDDDAEVLAAELEAARVEDET